jgi:hypothetical protein
MQIKILQSRGHSARIRDVLCYQHQPGKKSGQILMTVSSASLNNEMESIRSLCRKRKKNITTTKEKIKKSTINESE